MASRLNGTGVTFSDGSTQSVGTSGNFQFNSGYGSSATAYGCRTWANFSGINMTVNASGNVTSITDQDTGIYTVNFSSALSSTTYAPAVTSSSVVVYGRGVCCGVDSKTTTSCRVVVIESYRTNVYNDPDEVYIQIVR